MQIRTTTQKRRFSDPVEIRTSSRPHIAVCIDATAATTMRCRACFIACQQLRCVDRKSRLCKAAAMISMVPEMTVRDMTEVVDHAAGQLTDNLHPPRPAS